ncbi:MAG: pyridoxamine 5'-phosphate oxidase family protein [Oscillospiraceae bacterium]
MDMRRNDRAVTDEAAIDAIIRDCDCCRLGFVDGEEAYVVPVNFACVQEDGRRVFYIHGAQEGRKAELVRKNGRCCFELDTGHGVMTAEAACGYSFYYKSVIGQGNIAFVDDPVKKTEALNHIMARYSDRGDWSFPEAVLERTGVLRLEVTELSCKENRA